MYRIYEKAMCVVVLERLVDRVVIEIDHRSRQQIQI